MGLRKSLSKSFKKLRHRLTEGRRKQDGGAGSETDREVRGADAGGSEAGQRSSHLYPEVVESGPSREGDSVEEEGGRVDPATSTPSIPHGGASPTPSTLSQPLPVVISSGGIDNPPVLDRVREPAESTTRILGPIVVSEDTSNWKSAATPGSILRGVGESSGAYPPLKLVAECLCVILDNCEVRFPSTYSIRDVHSHTSERK